RATPTMRRRTPAWPEARRASRARLGPILPPTPSMTRSPGRRPSAATTFGVGSLNNSSRWASSRMDGGRLMCPPSCVVSRMQPAPQLLLGDLLHAQAQSGGAHGHAALAGQAAYLVERLEHQLFQLVVDLLLAPQELLDVLDPLKVGDRDAAGVAQDVRDDED